MENEEVFIMRNARPSGLLLERCKPEVREDLEKWLYGPRFLSFREVCQALFEKHGICISQGAVATYYHRFRGKHENRYNRRKKVSIHLPLDYTDLVKIQHQVGTGQNALDEFVERAIREKLARGADNEERERYNKSKEDHE